MRTRMTAIIAKRLAVRGRIPLRTSSVGNTLLTYDLGVGVSAEVGSSVFIGSFGSLIELYRDYVTRTVFGSSKVH